MRRIVERAERAERASLENDALGMRGRVAAIVSVGPFAVAFESMLKDHLPPTMRRPPIEEIERAIAGLLGITPLRGWSQGGEDLIDSRAPIAAQTPKRTRVRNVDLDRAEDAIDREDAKAWAEVDACDAQFTQSNGETMLAKS